MAGYHDPDLQNDPENSIHYRIRAVERCVGELEKYTDELRLGQNTREIQIVQLTNIIDRVERELEVLRNDINGSLKEINIKVERVEHSLNKKFDNFNRWLLGLTVGIIVSTVVIIISRLVTIPGAHL